MDAVLKPEQPQRVRWVGPCRKYDREALLKEFLAYIERTEVPVIAQFAALHGMDKALFYHWLEFSEALGICMTKKEGALEVGALSGKVNVTMAIFSLKQLGWSDKTEQTHRGDPRSPIVIANKDAQL